MIVKQALFGSGPLEGFVEGDDLSFTVTTAIGKIAFVGKRRTDAISGTYTVDNADAPQQQGTFTLRKLNSKGLRANFDVSNCPTDAEVNK
jgi:hypothetical protein